MRGTAKFGQEPINPSSLGYVDCPITNSDSWPVNVLLPTLGYGRDR